MGTLAPDPAESQRVREVLREWEASRPDVVMLAMFASLARRIEPELLRALRLKLKRFGDATQPWPTVGTEAALWFSPFVESRGADSITLQAEFSALLREKLRQWGKPPGGAVRQRNELLEGAREIIVQFHAAAPPVTRWEEDLIYLAVSEEGAEADRRSQLDREVWRAVKALASGQRRGLGEWIAEMGPRLPQTAQNTPLMARLQAATHSALAQKTTSPGTLHLGGIDFADVPSRVLEVARVTAGFRVGDLSGKGQFGIRVPDIEPVTVQLLPSDSSGETRTIIIPTGGTAEIPTGRGETSIRTIDGRVYVLERGVAGDSRDIAGIPYARAEFDKTGKLLNRVTIPHGTTDLIVIAHSWNNDVADAEEFYSQLFKNFAKVTKGDEAIRRRKLAILGVLWPSKRFGQPPPPAEKAGPGERAASQAEMQQSIDEAASLFDKAGDSEKLMHLSKLTADLDEDPDAQKGGITGFFGQLFSGAAQSAVNALNLTTFFEMQKRAATIGTAGMAPLLDHVDRQLEGIHLVGHSFGARLVLAAAAHSKTRKLHSLTLVQAALSHYDLSIKFGGQFSAVMRERRIAGPILVTYTKNDKAMGMAYPMFARLAGDKASKARATTEGTRGFGQAGDKYGAMGFNGAQGMEAGEVSSTSLLPVGEPYQWEAGRIHNLESSAYIIDHGDVTRPEIAWALSSAIASAPRTRQKRPPARERATPKAAAKAQLRKKRR